jgi:hypothetical protein
MRSLALWNLFINTLLGTFYSLIVLKFYAAQNNSRKKSHCAAMHSGFYLERVRRLELLTSTLAR